MADTLEASASAASKIKPWLDEVELYERDTENWLKRSKKIVKRYKDEREGATSKAMQFNILWSNTQTMIPALYAKNPKPDIQRRFKDADPVGRVASDVLERCASYFVDTDDFGEAIRAAVLDYLLGGRGTTWLRYVPHMKPAETSLEIDDDSAAEAGEEAKAEPAEVIDYEEVDTDFVHESDFGHNICRTWSEVWLVWRKVYMDRVELVKRFKDKGAAVPLDYTQRNSRDEKIEAGDSKATIYEAWDRKRKVAVWFHKSVPEPLDERTDPLKLEHFFPCPRPLLANVANDSLIPTPTYVQYQDQATELDNLTARIASLTKSLKVAGVYDASAQGLDRLLSEETENKLIPVEGWSAFTNKGGIAGTIDLLPIKDIAAALVALYEAREKVKADLYEITGIADIIRGQSDPNETMGAQKIKSNFATLRISDHQAAVQKFVREVIRIMVDIMGGHFQIETVKQISGVRLMTGQEKQMAQQAAVQAQKMQQPPSLPPGVTPDQFEQMMQDPTWEEVEQLIRNQPVRCFRIDIETDSTIKADEEAEKASRTEFLKAAGGFLQQANEVAQSQPLMVPLLGQMLMFGIRAFPVGKELEGTFNTTIQKLEKQAANPQPKPTPEMMKVQAEAQANQQKLQSDQQIQQAKNQGEMQLAHAKMQNEMQLEQARIQAKRDAEQAEAQSQAMIDQHENELEAQREAAKLQMEERIAMQKIAAESDLQLKIAHIKAAASIEVARIAAKASDGAEAESRESSGE